MAIALTMTYAQQSYDRTANDAFAPSGWVPGIIPS